MHHTGPRSARGKMDTAVEVGSSVFALLRNIIFTVVIIICVNVVRRQGLAALVRHLVATARFVPGVDELIDWALKKQVRGFLRQLEPESFAKKGRKTAILAIPKKGLDQEELEAELERRKKRDIDPHSGKIFAYVYTCEDGKFSCVQKAYDMFNNYSAEKVLPELAAKEAIVKMFFHAFMHENALNPLVFPSLRQFEVETVAMVANMLHGDGDCVGSITSGGTESIIMAVKTYRDRARKLCPAIANPEIVASKTVHPAFEKAAAYFDIKVVHVEIDSSYRVNPKAYKKAITENTILLVASATEYCYGMVDPVEEIGSIALENGLPLHVDSCIGGFMLPWVEKLGYPVPLFDFRVPAVTSMSADIHKYGLGAKGASVVVYKNADIRKYQIFAISGWPGGLFGSPSMSGTRPGGNIASSWAVLQCMGEDGYLKIAEKLMTVATKMKDGINAIEGLQVCGTPHMTILAFTSSDAELSIFAVADLMEAKGWKIERQLASLHCTLLPSHTLESADLFISHLKEACIAVKGDPSLARSGVAGVYGMVGMVPDESIVQDFLVTFFNEVYTL